MREFIIANINKIIRENDLFNIYWREPVVGFGDVNDEYFNNLTNIVIDSHFHPKDMLDQANTIISYFIPFTEELVQSNSKGTQVSFEWADAYQKTNMMIKTINQKIVELLKNEGYKAVGTETIGKLSSDINYSNFSQRHIAYGCGLGSFGLNNMLISEKGCCGRIGSIITSLKVETDSIINNENCLYKKNGSCQVCLHNCPNDALSKDGFIREKCAEVCQENQDKFKDGRGGCGKCLVNLPCSLNGGG